MAIQDRKYQVFDFTDLESHVLRLLKPAIECELFHLPSNSHYKPLVIVGSSTGINRAGLSNRFFILAPASNDEEMLKLYEWAKAEGAVYKS